MYINLIRRILERAVNTYAAASGKTVSEVLGEIRHQIDKMAPEQRKASPEIQYGNPLCRLGYLYRHATANATLFEHVITESGELRGVIDGSANKLLEVCAIGGGPGTELLGLAKYLLRRAKTQMLGFPRKINFAVLDKVPQWAETWRQLSDAVEQEFQDVATAKGVGGCPAIAPMFLSHDVLDVAAYEQYAYHFSLPQVIVFNYLFSETKTRFHEAKAAVSRLYQVVPSGGLFVVIDRLENNPEFRCGVESLFAQTFSRPMKSHTFDGTLERDEQTKDMGEMLKKSLGFPRTKFFTEENRDPTVFWFTAVKE